MRNIIRKRSHSTVPIVEALTAVLHEGFASSLSTKPAESRIFLAVLGSFDAANARTTGGGRQGADGVQIHHAEWRRGGLISEKRCGPGRRLPCPKHAAH